MNKKDKNDLKDIICLIIIIICAIIMAYCLVESLVFQFNNPDMTQMRLMMENPKPGITCIITGIIAWISSKILLK